MRDFNIGSQTSETAVLHSREHRRSHYRAKVAGLALGIVGCAGWFGSRRFGLYNLHGTGIQTTLPRIEGVSFPYYHSSPFPQPRLGDSGSLPILHLVNHAASCAADRSGWRAHSETAEQARCSMNGVGA